MGGCDKRAREAIAPCPSLPNLARDPLTPRHALLKHPVLRATKRGISVRDTWVGVLRGEGWTLLLTRVLLAGT